MSPPPRKFCLIRHLEITSGAIFRLHILLVLQFLANRIFVLPIHVLLLGNVHRFRNLEQFDYMCKMGNSMLLPVATKILLHVTAA